MTNNKLYLNYIRRKMAYELLLDDLLTELSDAGIDTAKLNIIEKSLNRINDISEFVLDNQTSLDALSNTNQLFSQATELKEENKELLSANINMHDALDLKSERVQELKKKLATAVEALEFASKDFVRVNGVKEETKISRNAKQALAEIGGEDEQ